MKGSKGILAKECHLNGYVVTNRKKKVANALIPLGTLPQQSKQGNDVANKKARTFQANENTPRKYKKTHKKRARVLIFNLQ